MTCTSTEQELQAETLALARAGDEPGDVGDGEPELPGLHDTEVGHQGRERVVRDLGPGSRQHRHERGLAGRREPDQRDIRQGLQLEQDVEGVAGLTEQGEAGCLAASRRERLVAQATAATTGSDELRVLAHQVGQDRPVTVLDHGAGRNGQDQVATVGAVAFVAGAGLAVGRPAVGVVVEVEQRRRLGVDAQDDVPAATTVAAVGSTERLELLTLDRSHAVAAVARGDVQHDAVDEAGHGALLSVLVGPSPSLGGDVRRGRDLVRSAPFEEVCRVAGPRGVPKVSWRPRSPAERC